MEKLTLLTHNKGKLREANKIASRYGVELVPVGSVEKFEIQSESLSEVSGFAARNAYQKLKKPLLVDDTGMFVKALRGFPGVYTAHIQYTIGNRGILKLMKGIEDRSAYSACALSFFDGRTFKCFVGRMDGSILKAEKGSGGFGFDPIFSPAGYSGRSLAELSVDDKNKVSHRGKAFDAFFRWYSR
jgi:XTP/dITP diphosphohydrolase